MRWLLGGMMLLSVLAACGTSADVGTGAAAATSKRPGYPRIASYFIETYIDEAQAETMAASETVIVDVEASAHAGDALRTIAKKTGSLLAYLTSEEITHQVDAEERPLAAKRFAAIRPEEWVLEPGSTAASAITATATRIPVADARAFTVARPASDFYGEDEPTYVLVDDEHMKLVGIDGDALVVERGYRSKAVAHAAGARVASHVVFFAGTWMLDLATPPWRERLVTEATDLVAKGPWNGIFLDVCFEDISFINGGLFDLDGDGVADDPHAGSQRWSEGMGLLVDALRAKIGPGVPIVSNPGGQNCPHPKLDGIMLEGWPVGLPPDFLSFEKGLDRYRTWSKDHPFTITNAFSSKIGFGTIEPGADEVARTDYPAMRFGLGVALLGDGLYTFDNGVFGHYVAWSYDEYDGAGRGKGWLGQPLGAPHVDGAVKTRAFEHGLVVVNTGRAKATVEIPAGYTKLAGTQDPRHNDGKGVSGKLTVAGKDAYILAR